MAHNPYTPPSAELADLAPGSLPAQPWQVKAAIGLLFLSLVVTVIGFALEGNTLGYAPGATRASYVLLSVGYLMMFGLVGLSVVHEVRYLPQALDLQSRDFIIYLLNTSMETGFVALLFTPAANRWVRECKRARNR
jgi:hypothetical protein